MKKYISLLIICIMVLSAVSVSAANLEVDGFSIKANLLSYDSTVYVSLSQLGKVMNKSVDTDRGTDSVFFNGINLFAEKGDEKNIYINGIRYEGTDVKIENGEVYLPAHSLADVLNKSVTWYEQTATLVFSQKTGLVEAIDPNKTYAIINMATNKAVSAKEEGLVTEAMTKADYQKFKFIKSDVEGYWHIQSVATGKNFDVNSHGTTPGVSIITWEMGTGDNQKFKVDVTPSGATISARSCHLPLEPYQKGIIQNSVNSESLYQKWRIVEFDSYTEGTATEKLVVDSIPEDDTIVEEINAPYRTFTMGEVSLTDANGLKAEATADGDNQKWTLTEVGTNTYVITNLATGKSIDVNARSLEEGGSIITYNTNSDANQRWILEQNGDGTFYIRSVHSSLYLTIGDNGLVQHSKNNDLKQRWTVNNAY